MVVLQSRLHDDAGGGDMGPLDGDAQPVVAASPTSRANQYIVFILIEELLVDLLDMRGDGGVIGGREVLVGLDIDHVRHILGDTVTQRVMRAQQTVGIGNLLQILVEHLLRVDYRTDLEQVELSTTVVIKITGELDLYRPAHLLGTILLRHLQQFGQREDALLEHAAEGDDLPSALIDAVADKLIHWVVGRGNIGERTIGIGLFHTQRLDVEAVVNLEVVTHMRHIQGIEASLRLTQGRFHLRSLQHLGRMIGRHTQGLSAVDDILTQSERETGDTFLGRLVAYWVVVQRAQHAGEIGIVEVAVLLAHHFLQDNRHLLLVDDVLRGEHIGLRVLIINGSIDTLDSAGQHAEHLVFVVQIRYHIGTVDTCERLIMRILKQRRRAYGDRRLHRLEEGEEVGNQRIGQLRTEEVLQNLFIRCIAQGNGIEIVFLHELIEEIGTEHNRLGNHHLRLLVLIQFRMALDDIIKESQTTTLSAKGALTDSGEVGVAVELQTVEDCHDTDVLHPPVLHDGVEDDLPVGIDILQLMPSDVLQESRYGEDGTGTKPTAHVISLDMAHKRIGGNLEDIVLQLLQRGDTGDFLLRHRIAEDEVAEAHVLLHQVMQVDVHLRRVLVDEVEPLSLCLLTVGRLFRVEDQRHILIAATDLAQQLQSGLRIAILNVT